MRTKEELQEATKEELKEVTTEEFQEATGGVALAWVGEQNKKTVDELSSHPDFAVTKSRCFSIISSKEKIPFPDMQNERPDYYLNFWQDKKNARGVLRETTRDSYRTQNPSWRVILDIDELARNEECEWVYQGSIMDIFSEKTFSLVNLSDGGGNACVMREFDMESGTFVQNGFKIISKAKSHAFWLDQNSLLVVTADSDPNLLTKSGYPRQVRLLKRGQSLSDAKVLFEVDPSHVSLSVGSYQHGSLSFVDYIHHHRAQYYFVLSDDLRKRYYLPIPEDAKVYSVFKNNGIIRLKSDWQLDEKTQFKKNDVLRFDIEKLFSKLSVCAQELNFQLLYRPETRCAVESITSNENALFLKILNNVSNEIIVLEPCKDKDGFSLRKLPLIEQGSISTILPSTYDDEVLICCENFLTPTTLFSYHSKDGTLKKLKEEKTGFNASPYQVTRHEAISCDNTLIPYHMVARKDLQYDGANPTLLSGYGGFGHALLPNYLSLGGINLLDKGFVYVWAYVRGGGELGAEWADGGRKENKQKSVDDFIAVAKDLQNHHITSPQFLGIKGASNGGFLVGACAVQRPELFGAVICDRPLLDMLLYHKLLAGDSWKGEYGDPDNLNDCPFLKKISPLHNIKEGIAYPPMFISASTTDDRVHPYHARIMTQALQALGNSVLFYEDEAGGHSRGVDLKKIATYDALRFVYLYLKLLTPALAHRSLKQSQQSAVSSQPQQSESAVAYSPVRLFPASPLRKETGAEEAELPKLLRAANE